MNIPSYIKNIEDRNSNTVADAEIFINHKELLGQWLWLLYYQVKNSLEPIGTWGLVNRKEMKFNDISYALDIVAIINPENFKSRALTEKLGFWYKKQMNLTGDDIECLLFSKQD